MNIEGIRYDKKETIDSRVTTGSLAQRKIIQGQPFVVVLMEKNRST